MYLPKLNMNQLILKILFIWERESTSGGGQQREREKQAPRWAGSPMRGSIAGPRELKADANRMSHPGVPKY